MASPVLLIVGLGNPGERYAETRHNAGLKFLQQVAADTGATFRFESTFEGSVANARIDCNDVRLFAPGTFMNDSGRAVAKVVRFFKVPVEQLLIAHDELDLPPGTVRLKLFKGACQVVGRKSPKSLYNLSLATYDKGDMFDQSASEGFIRIWGLPVRTQAQAQLLGEAEGPLSIIPPAKEGD